MTTYFQEKVKFNVNNKDDLEFSRVIPKHCKRHLNNTKIKWSGVCDFLR